MWGPGQQGTRESTLETRKLQLIGGGASFSVSLPKQWVEARGLKAGDEVHIGYGPDGMLQVFASGAPVEPKAERTVALRSNDADEVLRSVIALYVSGFDSAVLDHSGSDASAVRTGVGEACAKLHGLQIVEEDLGRLVLQDLSDGADFGFDKGLRRMQVVVLQMLRNVGRVIAGGGDAVVHESERCEAELDRILLLLMKQYGLRLRKGEFAPSAAASSIAGLHAMFVAQFLERIGDYSMRILSFSRFLSQDPTSSVTESVKTNLTALHGIVSDAIKSYNARDTPLANDVIRRALLFTPTLGHDGMFDTFTSPRSQPQMYSCQRCIRFFSLLECVERMALYAKSIAETAINWAMVDDGKKT